MKEKQCIMALPAKKRVFVCVLAALLALGAALCVVLRDPVCVTAYSQEERQTLSRDMAVYSLDCVIDEEDGTLDVVQEIDFVNGTGAVLPDLVLRTYANAFQSEKFSPAAIDELYDNTYGAAFSAGALRLQDVWWQGNRVSHSYIDDAQTVLRIETGDIAPEQQGKLRMHYVLEVPECAYRFGRTEQAWQLGNAWPVLALWEKDGWRTEEYYPIGDPFVSESAVWHVRLSLPDGWSVAASAPMEKGENGLWQGDMLCARDFAMVLYPEAAAVQQKFGDVTVQVFSTDESKKALALSGKILETLCELYGDYPYDALTIAQVDFPFGGMEYPGMVFVGSEYFTAQDDSLELLLAHEIAHQWFYALCGSDSFYHPWQDEAVCQWATIRYVHTRYGASSAENLKYHYVDAPMEEMVLSPVTPGSPVSYFSDYTTYSSVVYGRGCAFLLALDHFTQGQTDAFLRAYCHAAPFAIQTRMDFEQALNEFTGEDLSPLMEDYLDTLMQ